MTSIIEAGKAACESFDAASGIKILTPLAEDGNPEAQALVGLMYFLAWNIDQNIPEAIKWLTRAAEQGRGDAAHNLGSVHVSIGSPESKVWYRRARELGFIV